MLMLLETIMKKFEKKNQLNNLYKFSLKKIFLSEKKFL